MGLTKDKLGGVGGRGVGSPRPQRLYFLSNMMSYVPIFYAYQSGKINNKRYFRLYILTFYLLFTSVLGNGKHINIYMCVIMALL